MKIQLITYLNRCDLIRYSIGTLWSYFATPLHTFCHSVWLAVLHQSHSLTQTPVHCFIPLLQCPMGFVSMRLVRGRRLALGTHAIGPGLGTQKSRGRCVEEGHMHHLPHCHMPAPHSFLPPGHLFHVFLPLCPVYSRGCVSMIFAGEC